MLRGWGIIALLAITGCGQAKPVAQAPLAIRIAQVQSDQAATFITGSGTVAYRLETPLGFTSAGRVRQLAVQEGDRVRPGQLLAALRDCQFMGQAQLSGLADQCRMLTKLEAIKLPPGYRFEVRGEAETSAQNSSGLGGVILLALISSTVASRIAIPALYLVVARR